MDYRAVKGVNTFVQDLVKQGAQSEAIGRSYPLHNRWASERWCG
jgi:hypothetical protein